MTFTSKNLHVDDFYLNVMIMALTCFCVPYSPDSGLLASSFCADPRKCTAVFIALVEGFNTLITTLGAQPLPGSPSTSGTRPEPRALSIRAGCMKFDQIMV